MPLRLTFLRRCRAPARCRLRVDIFDADTLTLLCRHFAFRQLRVSFADSRHFAHATPLFDIFASRRFFSPFSMLMLFFDAAFAPRRFRFDCRLFAAFFASRCHFSPALIFICFSLSMPLRCRHARDMTAPLSAFRRRQRRQRDARDADAASALIAARLPAIAQALRQPAPAAMPLCRHAADSSRRLPIFYDFARLHAQLRRADVTRQHERCLRRPLRPTLRFLQLPPCWLRVCHAARWLKIRAEKLAAMLPFMRCCHTLMPLSATLIAMLALMLYRGGFIFRRYYG
jgi:hypothetical protein